jgi:hypothetical protein
MSENQNVEKFEKKVLFSVVRWFSLFMGVLGLLMLGYGSLMLVKSWTSMTTKNDVKIEYSEVDASMKQTGFPADFPSQEDTAASSSTDKKNPEKQKLIDENVKLLLADNPQASSAKLGEILRNQSAGLEEAEAILFFRDMKDVISKAPAGEKAAYTDKYIDLHNKKLQQEKIKSESRKFEAMKKLAIYAYVTISGLLTVVSFGIILILAAIERNTRDRPAPV